MPRPHTPITDKAEYEVRLGRHRRMVVRPELCRELELKNAALLSALEDIANPIAAMQRAAEAEGARLDGGMAIHLSQSAEYLKGIARSALALARTA